MAQIQIAQTKGANEGNDTNAVSTSASMHQNRLDSLQELYQRAKSETKTLALDLGSGSITDLVEIKRDEKGGYSFKQIKFANDSEYCISNNYYVNAKGIITEASNLHKQTSSEAGAASNIPNAEASADVDRIIGKFLSRTKEK